MRLDVDRRLLDVGFPLFHFQVQFKPITVFDFVQNILGRLGFQFRGEAFVASPIENGVTKLRHFGVLGFRAGLGLLVSQDGDR